MRPKWLAVGWLLRGIRMCFPSSSVLLPSSSCLLFTAICALISYPLLHPRGSPPFSLLLTTAISRRGRYTASLTRKPKLGDWEDHPSPSKIQGGHSSSCRVGQNLQDSEFQKGGSGDGWGSEAHAHSHQPLVSFMQLWSSQITARSTGQSGIQMFCHRMFPPHS